MALIYSPRHPTKKYDVIAQMIRDIGSGVAGYIGNKKAAKAQAEKDRIQRIKDSYAIGDAEAKVRERTDKRFGPVDKMVSKGAETYGKLGGQQFPSAKGVLTGLDIQNKAAALANKGLSGEATKALTNQRNAKTAAIGKEGTGGGGTGPKPFDPTEWAGAVYAAARDFRSPKNPEITAENFPEFISWLISKNNEAFGGKITPEDVTKIYHTAVSTWDTYGQGPPPEIPPSMFTSDPLEAMMLDLKASAGE